MRLVRDNEFECVLCRALFDVPPDAVVDVAIHGGSRKATERVITINGIEAHRCAMSLPRLGERAGDSRSSGPVARDRPHHLGMRSSRGGVPAAARRGTAEGEAIGRTISRLQQATGDEPREYWQAVLDDLEPFVGVGITNVGIASRYLVALRDRTDSAVSPQGRAVYIEDATLFLWQTLLFPRRRN